jgi:hypothetical protein
MRMHEHGKQLLGAEPIGEADAPVSSARESMEAAAP